MIHLRSRRTKSYKEDFHMKNRNKRPRRPIWRILFGIFCFLLLAFLLYASQFIASCYLHYDDSITELHQIQDALSSYLLEEEDFEQSAEEIYRQDIQRASLLFADQELSDEKLADLAQTQTISSGVIIFQEDGTPLYAYGDVQSNPDFLADLRESGSAKDENGHPYRVVPFENGLYLALSFAFDLSAAADQIEPFNMEVIESIIPGMSSDIIIANQKTDRMIYGPDNIAGRKLSDILITAPEEEEPILYSLAVDDEIILATFLNYGDYLLLSTFNFTGLFQNLHSTVTPALFGFGFLIFLLLAYTEFIRTDMGIGRLGNIHYNQISKKRYLNTLLLRKLSGFALVGITCMVCITYCLQLLIRSADEREHAESKLSIAARLLEANQTNLMETEKLNKEILIETAMDLRTVLSLNPALLSEERLNSLSRLYNFEDIYVLNESGKAEISTAEEQSFMLSNNATDDTYPFWNVISDFDDGHVQLVQNDPFSQDKDMMYVGVTDTDKQGMILCTFPYDLFKSWQQSYDAHATLKSVGLDSQSILLATNAGSTDCVFDSSNQYTGLSLDAYGLNKAYLRNGYSGTHMFDGKNCLITTRSVLDWNLIYITPTNFISASSWIFTAMAIFTSVLVAFFAVLPWLVVRAPGEDLRVFVREDSSVYHRSHVDAVITRDGVELQENRIEYHSMKRRWRRMNASEKLIYLIRALVLLVGCNLLYFFLFRVNTGDYPLIDLILERNWDKSVNVYALTYVIITLTGIWIVAKILQTITVFVTGTFSRRWKTLGILISNIIRYTALIASIFFTLQNIGVETSALITSASVLTLVFGLGCQSFVADMVAGVFLIFEGTFRVGDIVMVDNWRGEVVEIGLRSTNVKNELGNIKVFQNSRISGAINMTRNLTCAVCDVPLPAGEPLEAFEERLTSDFVPVARENIRTIRPPLEYKGVVAVNGDNATLRISVKCLESEREQLQRELYRELKLWRERTQNAQKNNPSAS